MAVEQGFVALLTANPNVVAAAPVGGFLAQLPQDQALPSWSYTTVADPTDYTLKGPVGLSERRIQIDCYGNTGAETITLASAIDAVLSGYMGTLPDGTHVQGCFHLNTMDVFDEESRTFRRMLEYSLWYVTP